jgi:hypothetical protein
MTVYQNGGKTPVATEPKKMMKTKSPLRMTKTKSPIMRMNKTKEPMPKPEKEVKLYKKGGKMPIVPDPKKKLSPADEKFNAAARSREAENLTEMRNALKEEGPEAVAKFDKELKAKGYKVISRNVKKMPGGGMMPKYKAGGKMYLEGGQVKLDKNKDGKISGEDFKMMKKYKEGGTVPGKDTWVGKGRQPQDPNAKGPKTQLEILETLTWKKAIEALDKRGVSMIDQAERPAAKRILGQGNANILDNNYELAIKKAKEYGVYDQARQEAVREYREQGKKKGGK